ncbi:MAG: hypothetical protein CMI32_06935 [Opitutales bacterium]|nr:hypothetical protein [Opitutales bacterium]|tara:strand:+ start:308 stop:1156 length:849 start_codon:yes stop_codon:yes gene_type:complete
MTSVKHFLPALLFSFSFLPLAGKQDILNLEPVTANESVMTDSFQEGSGISFIRVSETLEGSLLAALNDARKFTVVYRGKGSDPIAPLVAVEGRRIRLVNKIDDFQDYEKKASLEGLGEVVTKRTVRIGMVGSLFDVETSEMLASAKVRLERSETNVTRISDRRPVVRSQKILVEVSDAVAREMVTHCLDCLSPARVIAKTGKQITFNRGSDFGYPQGQFLEIYALGEDLKDPDTGDSLGSEEVLVGLAKVRRVTEKFSIAMIIEDHGIEKSHVVRPIQDKLN